MNNSIEQFSTTLKASVQALGHLASTAFAGTEKLVELNLTTSKAVLGESFNQGCAVLEAKEPQQWQTLQSGFIQTLSDHSSAYTQKAQAIVTACNAELIKAAEAQSAEAQKAMARMLDNLAKNAPAGTESAMTAFQSAMTAGQAAMESAQAQALKAVDAARSNVSDVTQKTVDAVKKAARVA